MVDDVSTRIRPASTLPKTTTNAPCTARCSCARSCSPPMSAAPRTERPRAHDRPAQEFRNPRRRASRRKRIVRQRPLHARPGVHVARRQRRRHANTRRFSENPARRRSATIVYKLLQKLNDELEHARRSGDLGTRKLPQIAQSSVAFCRLGANNPDPNIRKYTYRYSVFDAATKELAADLEQDPAAQKQQWQAGGSSSIINSKPRNPSNSTKPHSIQNCRPQLP